MRRWLLMIVLFLPACATGPSQACPPRPAPGFETYDQNGDVCRPDDAVDVYIVYSGGSDQYLPEIIRRFNQSYADGTHPVTGEPLGLDERPAYVWGTPPDDGPSTQGVINAFIAPENENVYRPTILQPSASHWLTLINRSVGRDVFNLTDTQATALSPLVIAVWENRKIAMEDAFGEVGISDLLLVLQNGWDEYGVNAARSAVYYGHTNPNFSTTALSSAIATYYACARDNGFDARTLTSEAVNDDAVQSCVRDVQGMVKHYSRSNRDFIEYIARGPEYLDFLPLEESDLICLNIGGQQGDRTCQTPGQPLVALYPAEGTLWHDYPFGIVDAEWVSEEQRAAARTFTDFVLMPENQGEIMRYGFRPANPAVELAYPLVAESGIDPDQPTAVLDLPDADVIATIQRNWTVVKKQADVVLLVDTSGSMNDENKLAQARLAAQGFVNQMEPTNRVALMTFDDNVTVRVGFTSLEDGRTTLINAIENLTADGGTELFLSVEEAVAFLREESDSDRIQAVLLLSDGSDTGDSGLSLGDAMDAITDADDRVMVIPLAYGSGADIGTLQALAEASATLLQSGSPDNIGDVLAYLSSYF